jgi:hypothetical protein
MQYLKPCGIALSSEIDPEAREITKFALRWQPLSRAQRGWEQPENGQRSSELRGHFSGHILSASAQLAAMGDKEAKAKGDSMVARARRHESGTRHPGFRSSCKASTATENL